MSTPSPTNIFDTELQSRISIPDECAITAQMPSPNNPNQVWTAVPTQVTGSVRVASASAESEQDGKVRDYYLIVADLTLQAPDPPDLRTPGMVFDGKTTGTVTSWSISISPLSYDDEIAQRLKIEQSNWQAVAETELCANQPSTTPETTSYTNSMSQSLGLNCGFFGDQGTASFSYSLTAERSTTVTVGDVEVELDVSDNAPVWTFIVHGNSASHAITPEVQVLFDRLDDGIDPSARSGAPEAYATAPVAVFLLTVSLQWRGWDETDEGDAHIGVLSGSASFAVPIRVPPVPASANATRRNRTASAVARGGS
jgi:hypothetical protein